MLPYNYFDIKISSRLCNVQSQLSKYVGKQYLLTAGRSGSVHEGSNKQQKVSQLPAVPLKTHVVPPLSLRPYRLIPVL